ncbi:riboflavin synthase [Kangiella koreensis]|uniref:Riboflavin synthase n=1 Tax=Kangiella koreensis (strain DSM 16069 / JCM 12317 / KCTC 12182 / SW-125) TaxID=523791 RepID=C7R8M9_KANKD|nr:riboflavin synthase [Kangiella koreensis]ACV25892.1 riboflavin synthase, alpha subunit [Kangiella koreensis DSM 16069]
MFTGIIEATGYIAAIEPKGEDARYRFQTGKLDLSDVELGDSIACNGVCLTVIEKFNDGFAADVSVETIKVTCFKHYQAQQPINFEKAMLPTTRFGGHMVSGHVDGIGEVMAIEDAGRSIQYTIRAPQDVLHYIAIKGSITVDGTSLTVNQIKEDCFFLNLVPHTLQETIADSYKVGTKINLEIDLIARYLERLMQTGAVKPQ